MGKCYFFCNHKEFKLVDKDLGVRESERERLSCSFLISVLVPENRGCIAWGPTGQSVREGMERRALCCDKEAISRMIYFLENCATPSVASRGNSRQGIAPSRVVELTGKKC